MKYIFSYFNPHQHYIDIEFIANIQSDETIIQLPAWRPGRYELGNFAKNIQKWAAFDQKGNPLSFYKITKDSWKVSTKGIKQLHIKYNYFAFELNAGSTFLNEQQLYVNPVNCCVFIPENINETCELEIKIPDNYKIAIGAKEEIQRGFKFKNYHQLADTPFICSNSLQHQSFEIEKITFHLWFQGECKPNWEKLISDFTNFCLFQLQTMQNFPSKEYHFLFQITSYKIYHGVEHITSTVIALGPGTDLMEGDLYEDLLGVSCHELFHVWNVKTIRPTDMLPYDYTKENYSRLGYVYEGVTTYYGDLLLYRSGVFSEEQYFKTFNERLQKHFDNFGRFNLSVADSSFDTWLDGYIPGIPNRKTNIYDEGCLLAFITDIFIRKNSNNKHSLDDVMRHLNKEFALKEKGYSEKDYQNIIEQYANTSFESIFKNYFYGTNDYEPILIEAMNYIGCELIKMPSTKFHEHALGFKTFEINGVIRVTAVYPNSVADEAGLSLNDEILSCNNITFANETNLPLSNWSNHFITDKLNLTITNGGIIKSISVQSKPNNYYKNIFIKKVNNCTEKQNDSFHLWIYKY